MKQFSLEEYLANPSRKVVTRDGRAVKIYCTDYIDEDNGSVIAKIEGDTYSNSFREDGRFVVYEETDHDLFFAPEKHEGWMHIYKHINGHYEGDGIVYNTKEQCEVNQSSCILNHFQYEAIAKIEWEE